MTQPEPTAHPHPGARDTTAFEPGATSGLPRLADHWGLVLAYGLITVIVGVILGVWPDETLEVCAILIAIQFLVSGLLRVASALTATSMEGGVRALLGFSGALAVIVGLLCLRDPLQTVLAIYLLLGVWWLISGVIDIISAVISPVHGRRAWDLAAGAVSVAAGAFLLIYPDLSLDLFVLLACGWLLLSGLFAIFAAVALRAAGQTSTRPARLQPPEAATS
ncbi:DUF308 domain-containing protein [Nocardioides sp. NPDC092400]|uniref:HdeD family acid-resistance protein n=1 Tax=Nocardioides sp. NPDC092400 TaxID=3155196 RepID=UPI0034127F36